MPLIEEVCGKGIIVAQVPSSRDEVVRLLAKHAISGVPVVKGKNRKLVGIITRQDILRNPEETQTALIMSRKPLFISPKDSIKKAARIMYDRRIHRLPVVEDSKLVGICTTMDLLKIIAKTNTDETLCNYMGDRCIAIYQFTPLPVVAEVMSLGHVYASPVLDERAKLVGIVTDSDLFKLSWIEEDVAGSDMGLGEDEDQWTWEGIRSVMRLYYVVSKVNLPPAPAKDVMVTDLVKGVKQSNIRSITKSMVKKNLSQVPVEDGEGKLIGMITDTGLLKFFLK